MGQGSIVHFSTDPDTHKVHTRIEYGRSTSIEAESGVEVVFSIPFPSVPKVVIGQFQEKETWIKEVTEKGFVWFATQEEAEIDWIAIGAV